MVVDEELVLVEDAEEVVVGADVVVVEPGVVVVGMDVVVVEPGVVVVEPGVVVVGTVVVELAGTDPVILDVPSGLVVFLHAPTATDIPKM